MVQIQTNLIKKEAETEFRAPAAYQPDDTQIHVYNTAVPHQPKLTAHLQKHHFEPRKGIELAQYHGTVGHFTGGDNAFVHEAPPYTLLAKKNHSMYPGNREFFGINDTQMSLPQREVAFHNLAHQYFGLGSHVPQAVLHREPGGEHWSVHEWQHGHKMATSGLPMDQNEAHVSPEEQSQHLGELHKTGKLPQLAAMDYVLGNVDRTASNALWGPQGELKLIDNGLSFSKKPNVSFPGMIRSYYSAGEHKSVPGAASFNQFKDWALSLKPEKLNQLMDYHSIPEKEKAMALGRLDNIHRAVQMTNNLPEFFEKAQRSVF